MASDYVTLYEISWSSIDWSFALSGFIWIPIGLAIGWAKRRFPTLQIHRFLPAAFCGFGVLWLVLQVVGVLVPSIAAYRSYQRKDFRVVEGVVREFDPMPYEGHQDECFSVQIQRFCYSDFGMEPGFHNAASHGGPIREGLPVRISYSGSTIYRIQAPADVAQSPVELNAIARDQKEQYEKRTESDPLEQRFQTAFLISAGLWVVWWNVQWRRVMRAWVKPPYAPATEIGFRIFFALNLVGVLISLIRQLWKHPIGAKEVGPLALITGTACVVMAVMSITVLRIAESRDAREAKRVETFSQK